MRSPEPWKSRSETSPSASTRLLVCKEVLETVSIAMPGESQSNTVVLPLQTRTVQTGQESLSLGPMAWNLSFNFSFAGYDQRSLIFSVSAEQLLAHSGTISNSVLFIHVKLSSVFS